MNFPVLPPLPEPARGLLVVGEGGGETLIPLRLPVVMVGRGKACDLVIHDDALRPLHALLAPASDGVHIRAVGANTVRVNDAVTAQTTARDGDTIQLGRFVAVVRWPLADDLSAPSETLRRSAAAVVAQGLELLDREIGLEERAAALGQQEAQVAGHLEDERRQLLELQSQVAEARDRLRRKRAALAEQTDRTLRDLDAARQRADDHERQAATDRQRVRRLFVRIKARSRRQRTELLANIAERERVVVQAQAKLAAERQEVAASNAVAQETRAALDTAVAELRTAQHAYTAETNRRKDALRDLARTTELRRQQLAAAERELAGVEERIRNARERLPQTERVSLAAPDWLTASPASSPEFANEREQLAEAVGAVADQRRQLAEQAERLLRQQQIWHAEREREVQALETIARHLADRDERSLTAEAEAERGRAELADDRASWERQRAADEGRLRDRQARIDADDARTGERIAALHDLYRRWGQRRQHEWQRLRGERERGRVAHEQWQRLRELYLRERGQLLEQQQALAALAMSLEETRAAYPGNTDDPATARKLLERSQKQWDKRLRQATRDLTALGDTLREESDSLGNDQRDADRERDHLIGQRADLNDLLADSERRVLQTTAEAGHWQRACEQLAVQLADLEAERDGTRVPLGPTLRLRVA